MHNVHFVKDGFLLEHSVMLIHDLLFDVLGELSAFIFGVCQSRVTSQPGVIY